ncbi:AAA family ATPase [Halogeometricum sp. S1BR25-6]|uniref:AAA family ATPase n=1 Tax=Halogeometricum salsisoli TaxID=2950536 RepID=A0ABU2GJG6_9EURY|nr:AAA family ATPase [Halogeometricum sp. S1BR25-6]MDS0300920.1 AAA family ATPase [Halogeometricum sp. S1BR25-6]
MADTSRSSNFIADAEWHNEWWNTNSGRQSDLSNVTSLTPRSDLLNLLRSIDEERERGIESLAYPIYGPTGIGKTTLLRQFIAAILESDVADFSPGNRDPDIIGSVDPRQILYVPLEDSLYHLEPSSKALERLRTVIDYFYSHIAPRRGRKYIILDDVGALQLDNEQKRLLLEFVQEDTYLLLTGIVKSQVDLRGISEEERLKIEWPRAMLPMKFVETVQQNTYDDTALTDVDIDFNVQIESLRTTSIDGDALIKKVRNNLSTSEDLDTAVAALNQLYFEAFSDVERDGLYEAAREYLQKGGILLDAEKATVKNELVRSHFLLYLYKELAKYESIQRPENLHRIASLAASQTGKELQYTDISKQLEVDRRTVDTYLSVLDEGIAVSESHDFSLQRHRRTRLYLRNPRHVVLLSQRQEHHGFEAYERTRSLNYEFEYKLARTVAFDHAKRLAWKVSNSHDENTSVEYAETEAGTVDYILHNDKGLILPFVLSYHPHAGNADKIATQFDPTSGKHPIPGGEELRELNYKAPYRFIITDSLPKEVEKSSSLVIEQDGVDLCYVPYWLFLLIC